MIEMVVVLYLTVWDADTGVKLAEEKQVSPIADGIHDMIELCRISGVKSGMAIAASWRANGYPNAFANVDCQWERASI